MAFAAPIAAFSATQQTPDKFNAIFRFGITPLFLFSGTFFPISIAAGRRSRPIAWLTPLCHGVELTRGLSLGTIARRPARRARPRRRTSVDAGRRSATLGWRDHGPIERRLVPRMTGRCRVTPAVRASAAAARCVLVERNLYVYRHGWMVLVSGFFEPLFYLLGIGFGLGALIGTVPGPGGQPIAYQLFVAPALLATRGDERRDHRGTFNFFFKLNYNKTFDVDPVDAAVGPATSPSASSAGR